MLQREEIIANCIGADSYEYLSLILKYFDKNSGVVTNGLNFYSNNSNPPLISLLSSNHCNDEWVNLFLFDIWNCVESKARTKIEVNTLQEAFLTCNNAKWLQMIQKYADMTALASLLRF